MAEPRENIFAALARRFVPWKRFSRAEATILTGGTDCRMALDPASLKVMNWNIARSNYGALWQKDFLAAYSRFVPDLLCFQEVRLDKSEHLSPELIDLHWNYVPNFIDEHHNAYSGILTAARAMPVSAKALLTSDSEPLSGTPKASLVSIYQLVGLDCTLLVANSHFINFVSLAKFRAQMSDLEHNIATHRGPVLFSGDFNTWNLPRTTVIDEVVGRLGLKAVIFESSTNREQTFLPFPTLDYIFYRDLQVRGSGQRLHHVFSSDHKPMIAEFFMQP